MAARETSKERKYIPTYLRGKYQIIASVTFKAFFSLVFMLVSIPFSHNAWFGLGASQAFAFTALFYIICLLFVILSRRILYVTRRLFKMTYLQYVVWCVFEALFISLLYSIFSIQGDMMGIIHLEEPSFVKIFLNATVFCFVALIIPDIISGMFFAIIDKNKTIRVMNYRNVVSDEPIPVQEERKITLFDNNGTLQLSVNLSNLFYIESDDNYIIVWYEDSSGELKRYMVRCRLKTVEESFKDTSLVRCHRQYIVNMDRVKVLKKEKEGYVLELDEEGIPPIPITKTYSENVLSRFNEKTAK